jgi:hypothetical protein
MKRLSIVFAILAAFFVLAPSVNAASISCSTFKAYQKQTAKVIQGADYADTMNEFADLSPDELFSLPPSKLRLYGSATLEFASDMKSMKNIDPTMKPYHNALVKLFQNVGTFMTDAATMGTLTSAMAHEKELTDATDAFNEESAKLPTNC